jgi:NAD(P)-dependent dehydrogenase (short-subunit alcohol dehydrogenase family)
MAVIAHVARNAGSFMQGKVVVITGATSGIGKVVAYHLARQGARILFIARDPQRSAFTLARLKQLGPDAGHRALEADLSRLSELKRIGAEIAAAEPRIDVLINNAGAYFGTRRLTEDALERTFALNHISYFVLTCALADRLKAAAPARVVSTASDAHRGARLDFGDLQFARGYDGLMAYRRSKLANILFTRELARRLAGSGVTANCLHPGFVATRFGDQGGGWLSLALRAAKLFAISPEKGAETIIHLAASPAIATTSGGYFYKCQPAIPTAEAQDDTAAVRLWAESAKIAEVDL